MTLSGFRAFSLFGVRLGVFTLCWLAPGISLGETPTGVSPAAVDEALRPFVAPLASEVTLYGWKPRTDAEIFLSAGRLDHPGLQRRIQSPGPKQAPLEKSNLASETPFTEPRRGDSSVLEYKVPAGTGRLDLSSPQVDAVLRGLGLTAEQALKLTTLPVVASHSTPAGTQYDIKVSQGVMLHPLDGERLGFDEVLSKMPHASVGRRFFGGILLNQVRQHPDKDYSALVLDPKVAPRLSDELAVGLLLDRLHKAPGSARQIADQFFKANPTRNPNGAFPEEWVREHALQQILDAKDASQVVAIASNFLVGNEPVLKGSHEFLSQAAAGADEATRHKIALVRSVLFVTAAEHADRLTPELGHALAEALGDQTNPYRGTVTEILQEYFPPKDGRLKHPAEGASEEAASEVYRRQLEHFDVRPQRSSFFSRLGFGGRGPSSYEDEGSFEEPAENHFPAQLPVRKFTAVTKPGEHVKVGIIGDSHGNEERLREIVRRMKSQGVTHILSIGDMTDGSEDSLRESLKIIADESGLSKDRLLLMPGNWEHVLMEKGKIPRHQVNRIMEEYGTLVNDHFFGQSEVKIGDRNFLVSHYPVTKISPLYLKWPLREDTQTAYERDVQPSADTDLVLFGHTHAANLHFDQKTGRYFLNLGTLGSMKKPTDSSGYAVYDGPTGQLAYHNADTHQSFATVAADRNTVTNRPKITAHVCKLNGL